jgi:hypothetical protein
LTNPTRPKPNPAPAILVYGTTTNPSLTQASWFRAEDKEAVKAVAAALKFSVIELRTDADRALCAGVHEGVLKGSGRMIVGSVSAEVYRRIEEHVRKGAGDPDPSNPDNAAATIKPVPEQNMNIPRFARLAADKPDLADALNPWEAPRGSGRTFSPPFGTRMKSLRASGSPRSKALRRASSPSSGSSGRNTRRSRARRRTSPSPTQSSA